jgi:hypothetical protein
MRTDESLQLRFEVGKYGRKDRFVLVYGRPGIRQVIANLQTEPGHETAAALALLDDAVRNSRNIGVLYSNARKHGYCIWERMKDRSAWATRPEITPIYACRFLEQQKICKGTLKRGHTDFGFLPMEGHR